MKYITNKKQYFLNLRSSDANTENVPGGNQIFKFSWNISNINVSRKARIAISNFAYEQMNTTPYKLFIIRCPQVKNHQYDSRPAYGPVIFAQNFARPVEKTYYPLDSQNIDRIDLIISNNISTIQNGIPNTEVFMIQFEIEDFDEEEVNPALMPSYTKDSLTYHYPNSSTVIPPKGI
jgi:hypothetical protein